MHAIALHVLAIIPAALAAPAAPGLTPLYTMNATLGAPIAVGRGWRGQRTVIPITGGTFGGPRMSGQVLDLGADWGVQDPDGVFHPDTRYQLRTDDGADIFIQTTGPGQPGGGSHLHCFYETGHAGYYWLNDIVAVGILSGGDGYVVIDAWQVTAPASNATA
ncbi:hypothetical protein F4780DRAFT_738956 [Xylariomycetidae sp. FL0641]|nr:hypothetical protein F4780DRAFT_738956 [Xylariomycetidae sp. FL0641]